MVHLTDFCFVRKHTLFTYMKSNHTVQNTDSVCNKDII